MNICDCSESPSNAGFPFSLVLQQILEDPNLDLDSTAYEPEPEHGPNEAEPVQLVGFRSMNRFRLRIIS
jgi:hypothetical protein